VANNNPRRHPPKPVQIPVTLGTDKEEANEQSNNKKVDRRRVNPVEVKEKARNLMVKLTPLLLLDAGFAAILAERLRLSVRTAAEPHSINRSCDPKKLHE